MSADTDWQALVHEYAARGRREAEAVAVARQQAAERLGGTPEYWEAVYTLARQSVEMSTPREEV